MKCKLRLLKMQRVNDFLLLEEVHEEPGDFETKEKDKELHAAVEDFVARR